MSKINSLRKSCKDVFNAFLVMFATYAGFFEFPRIEPIYEIPNRLIDRIIFILGLAEVIRILNPTVIVVYGAAPDSIFAKYKKAGIKIVQFDSEISISRKEVV